MRFLKILFVSSSPLNKEISIGNTFINLFKDMEDVELASIYTRAGSPDKEISQAFCITEKMLIRNLIKNTPVGVHVESEEKAPKVQNTKNEHGIINFMKSHRWTVFFWLQNFIWKIGRWKSPELKKFVEEFNRQLNTGDEPAFVKQWKSLVIANAAVKYQADEIVAPIFIITPNANKTEVEVKMTGYVGKYKNFRKATEKDINFLNTYNGAK